MVTSNLFRPVRSISGSLLPLTVFLTWRTPCKHFIRLTVSQRICLIYSHLCIYSIVGSTRLLLNCGVDVNVGDLVSLLCDAGVQLDCVNTNNETLTDIAQHRVLKQLLTSKMKLGLKYICARIIRGKNPPFQGFVSRSLVCSSENH